MEAKVIELAYAGKWEKLLALLHRHPDLVNSASESKGYTPMHQAAWHGAQPRVIGELLALGANPFLRTKNKHQTALDIAKEKHETRADLHYLLAPQGRTAAQLIRKITAENRELFGDYDGNHVLCDRLIDCFGADLCSQTDANFEERLKGAFKAATGLDWTSRNGILIDLGESFRLNADPTFWADRFLAAFRAYAARSITTPIEQHWATVTDLFDPVPESWGLRGDLYLWIEMRSALNHVPIPDRPEALGAIISSLFLVLTGTKLSPEVDVTVTRFARGGMSSGMVNGEFWHDTFVPMIQKRAQWLKEAWGS